MYREIVDRFTRDPPREILNLAGQAAAFIETLIMHGDGNGAKNGRPWRPGRGLGPLAPLAPDYVLLAAQHLTYFQHDVADWLDREIAQPDGRSSPEQTASSA